MKKAKKPAAKEKKPKLGTQSLELFAPTVKTVEEPKTEEDAKRGRPKHLSDDMTKTTLTISLRQLVWLDRLCSTIRENSRAIVDRGAIIRALIDALEECMLDITHCSSEEEIQKTIAHKLADKKTPNY